VLNVHGVRDVRQMDIHTAEPLVPEPSLVKVENAIQTTTLPNVVRKLEMKLSGAFVLCVIFLSKYVLLLI
jgi:hypothetical protein